MRSENVQDITGPTTERQRYLILDVLRGLALVGIALANYPEFALWTFLSGEEQAAIPTAETDRVVRFLQYLLVDGKFYTIFSLLFGVGFSLILDRHGRRLFVRRMLMLLMIGFLHLMFVWSGDILLLYAVGGLLLTLFVRLSDRALLWVALLLILAPVGLDALTEFCGISLATPLYNMWWTVAGDNGITEDNFATWLRDATDYREMFAFLRQGACERMWEFAEGHRLPKVLGLFLLGYLTGKHRLYARLDELPLKRVFWTSVGWGLPLSLLYAWSSTDGRPWGLTAHSLLYALSVIPLALAYVCAIALICQRQADAPLLRWIAAPGRMALTCYISQSLIGILLFYGVGLGLGASFGLIHAELTALVVCLFLTFCCRLWLRYLRFGPLEWLWRMFTYGRYFPIVQKP